MSTSSRVTLVSNTVEPTQRRQRLGGPRRVGGRHEGERDAGAPGARDGLGGPGQGLDQPCPVLGSVAYCWSATGYDRGDGVEDRGQGDDAGRRRAGAPRLDRRGGGRRRLPVARQGVGGRRRAGHAHRARRRRPGRRASPRPSGRRGRPSATAPCSPSATSTAAATSRSRCSPTSTATWPRCSSGSARSSGATRRSSRRRPPRPSTPSCAGGCATPRSPRRGPSATWAPARSSSCSSRTAGSGSWR